MARGHATRATRRSAWIRGRILHMCHAPPNGLSRLGGRRPDLPGACHATRMTPLLDLLVLFDLLRQEPTPIALPTKRRDFPKLGIQEPISRGILPLGREQEPDTPRRFRIPCRMRPILIYQAQPSDLLATEHVASGGAREATWTWAGGRWSREDGGRGGGRARGAGKLQAGGACLAGEGPVREPERARSTLRAWARRGWPPDRP